MPRLAETEILVPFGTARLTPDLLTTRRETGGGWSVDCRVPFVILDPSDGGTLRLNSGLRAELRGGGLPEGAGGPDALAALRDVTLRHCDLWSRPQARFVARYFDSVSAQVERHRDELAEALARFGTMYDARDWVFSAPLPLPRAHLPLSRHQAGPDGRIRVDFAFWSRGRPVAVELTGTATVTDERRARRDALRAEHVEIVEIDPGELADERDLLRLLPADFHAFWRDQPFPTGPFAPDLSPP